MPTPAIPRRALILLVVLTLVWGTNWPLFPFAVREVSVWTFRAVSVLVAGGVLLAVARLRGQSLVIPRRHWPTIAVATFFYLVVWNIASTYSAILIPSGQSAVLGFTMPLWAALIAWAVLGEKLSGRMLLAIALGGLGVTLLMLRSFTAYAQAPLGLVLGLTAGLGWAIGTLILKRRVVDVPATVLTGWQLLITALPIGIGALVVGDHQWFIPSWATILVIAYITLVPMAIGNVCWFAIVGLLPTNVAGLSSILVPVVAMVSGAIVHGEPLGPLQWAAMGCCAAALSLALLKPAAGAPRALPAARPGAGGRVTATAISAQLASAIEFAVAHETAWSREVGDGWGIHLQDPPPWNRLFGPVHGRGPVSGTIRVEGRTLAAWGEPERADLTFSVAKTYLALLAGVAHERGLLPDVDEPVGARVRGIGFDSGRNGEVTWLQLLQQTSEWEGACFGIPEQVDRYRSVQFQPAPAAGRKGDARPLQAPGTHWEYNDVRINQLSLALLHLFGEPLPEVFREAIMQPIGASDAWRWVGYDDAWVTLNGRRLPSVPGGSHWGGGISISSTDQARIGQLLLDEGRCNGRQLLSAEWIVRMQTPCAIAPFYGCLVWLNTGRQVFASVPASSWFAIGAGSSITWIEPERRLVLVVRWIDAEHADAFFGRVLEALDARS